MISPAISRESIETINREFWAAMAAIDLHVAIATPERWNDPEGMTGRIEIRGEWNGSIEICVSWALARDAAAEMIGKDLHKINRLQTFWSSDCTRAPRAEACQVSTKIATIWVKTPSMNPARFR